MRLPASGYRNWWHLDTSAGGTLRRFGATHGCSPHSRDVSLGASVGAKADIYPAPPMLRSGWVKALIGSSAASYLCVLMQLGVELVTAH